MVNATIGADDEQYHNAQDGATETRTTTDGGAGAGTEPTVPQSDADQETQITAKSGEYFRNGGRYRRARKVKAPLVATGHTPAAAIDDMNAVIASSEAGQEMLP